MLKWLHYRGRPCDDERKINYGEVVIDLNQHGKLWRTDRTVDLTCIQRHKGASPFVFECRSHFFSCLIGKLGFEKITYLFQDR